MARAICSCQGSLFRADAFYPAQLILVSPARVAKVPVLILQFDGSLQTGSSLPPYHPAVPSFPALVTAELKTLPGSWKTLSKRFFGEKK